MRNLPNIISALRLILSPYVFILAYREELLLSGVLFMALLISDALDGALARLLNAHSKLGKMLDPLADKVLLLFGLLSVALFSEQRVSLLLIKAVVIRDLFLIGGTMFLRKLGFVPQPSPLGKSATVVLGLTVALGFLLNFFESSPLLKVYSLLQFLSGILVVVSGIDYGIRGSLFLRSKLIMERR
jgi:CDP-diacylglycerol--glycerol-3-phosphate 3-phosphatidyltransferase